MPFALLTGPFLPDLFLSLIVIIFIYFSFKEGLLTYYKNNFFYIFILFYFLLVISSLLSINVLLSLESSLFYFRFIIFSLAVWFLIENNKNLLKNFAIFFLLSFIFALTDGYYQYFNGVNIFGFIPEESRMTLLLNDKQILGGYLSRLFPLLLAVLMFSFKANKYNLFISCVLLIATDTLIYMTGERTALGLLFISTLFIIFFISKYKFLRLITFIFSILIIIFLTLFDNGIKERNIDHTINKMGIEENSSRVYYLSETHETLIITGFRIFQEYPIIGAGPKIFRELCSSEKYYLSILSCSTHPHNSYIQILSETGFVGFIFICIILFYVFYQVILHIYYKFSKSKLHLDDFQVCIIGCFIMTLWPFLPTQNFFNNWISIVYFLPVGFYLQSIYRNKKIQ